MLKYCTKRILLAILDDIHRRSDNVFRDERHTGRPFYSDPIN